MVNCKLQKKVKRRIIFNEENQVNNNATVVNQAKRNYLGNKTVVKATKGKFKVASKDGKQKEVKDNHGNNKTCAFQEASTSSLEKDGNEKQNQDDGINLIVEGDDPEELDYVDNLVDEDNNILNDSQLPEEDLLHLSGDVNSASELNDEELLSNLRVKNLFNKFWEEKMSQMKAAGKQVENVKSSVLPTTSQRV